MTLAQLAKEPFILYPATPRPSYADHVLALFANHGLIIQVNQWTNELQTAIGLVAAGIGVTLVPSSVKHQHRPDIVFCPLVEREAISPIILSHRSGDVSDLLAHCLSLIATHKR